MADIRRALVDTSVLVDLELIPPGLLPDEMAVATISLAELSAGPYAAVDTDEAARRQVRLQLVEANLEPIPFDVESARAYGRIYSAVITAGRKARGARAVDLMIAATALGAGLPLFTRNPEDFAGLSNLLQVIPV